jgi:hypothetical protein
MDDEDLSIVMLNIINTTIRLLIDSISFYVVFLDYMTTILPPYYILL